MGCSADLPITPDAGQKGDNARRSIWDRGTEGDRGDGALKTCKPGKSGTGPQWPGDRGRSGGDGGRSGTAPELPESGNFRAADGAMMEFGGCPRTPG
jgi:hypothetical protein